MNVGQTLTVNGKMMQDSRSTDMIHNIYDLVEYSTSILTMFPGDVIASGSPAGTGMSRSVRPEQISAEARRQDRRLDRRHRDDDAHREGRPGPRAEEDLDGSAEDRGSEKVGRSFQGPGPEKGNELCPFSGHAERTKKRGYDPFLF